MTNAHSTILLDRFNLQLHTRLATSKILLGYGRKDVATEQMSCACVAHILAATDRE